MQHVLQGDLGTSLRTRRSVNEELRLRLPVTIELTLLAALLGTIPAMAVGVLAAVRRNSALDYAATIGTLLGVSVPNFLLATLLVLVFSLWLRWLPPIGYVETREGPVGNLKTMIMPAISLGLPLAAVLMRNTRSAVLEVLSQEHVRVARAKGLTERRVLGRHVILQRLVADHHRRRHPGRRPAGRNRDHRDRSSRCRASAATSTRRSPTATTRSCRA